MAHGLHDHAPAHKVLPRDKAKILKIWKTALLLAVVTAIEFLLAFTMERGSLLFAVFIGLTLVKAFYIVADFMHLKYETKVLVWSIVLPIMFVIWLIVALLAEGDAIFKIRSLWGWF